QLTEAVRRKPYSVILLDEIEKAHPDTFNILLQVLDEGRLTDNKGRVADFRNTIIIMTSNIGSHIIQEKLENIDMNKRSSVVDKTKEEVLALLKKTIRPEFLNRIDEIVMFTPLNESEVKAIVRMQISNLQEKLSKRGIKLNIDNESIAILAKMGYEPQFGARPVKRVIQREILNEISKLILAGDISAEGIINVTVNDNKLVFSN
ncbi:MAG TPA: type VI secretion system ATPase TssH, partial [Bacteroidales bacterium]|nr:type VI secretion system ATPase TssH [Bacteroidales bacterium]